MNIQPIGVAGTYTTRAPQASEASDALVAPASIGPVHFAAGAPLSSQVERFARDTLAPGDSIEQLIADCGEQFRLPPVLPPA